MWWGPKRPFRRSNFRDFPGHIFWFSAEIDGLRPYFVICVVRSKTTILAVKFQSLFWTYVFLAVQYRNRWFGTMFCDLCGGDQNNHSGGQFSEIFLDISLLAVQHRNRWFRIIFCDLCGEDQNDHSGGQISEMFLNIFLLAVQYRN